MDWFGRARMAFTHAPLPHSLKRKDGTETNILQICEKTAPSCQLNPLLFNGHLQTMWTATPDDGPPIYYKRKIFDAEHKTYIGTFAVDFAVEPHEETDDTLPPRTVYYSEEEFTGLGSDDRRPMLIVLHGLSGGSHEVYLRHCLAPLLSGEGDWAVCVVNSRGCAMSKVTSGVLFNARATWDVRQIVAWAHKTFPNRPLFGLGFSLGANILTNFVAEDGKDCLLKAAIAVANPWDLQVSNKSLQNSMLGKEVYQRVMGGNMRALINQHKESITKHTKLNWERIQDLTYLFEFDREVQCITWGYPTEEAYYRDASSVDSVLAIRIPFLAISAEDDPIAVKAAIPYAEFKVNPYTVLLTTSLGGHLGFFEVGGGRWHARPVTNFFRHMASEIELDWQVAEPDVYTETHGAHFDPLRRKLAVRMD